MKVTIRLCRKVVAELWANLTFLENSSTEPRWSDDDVTLLYSAVEAIGLQWFVISKEWFGGRVSADSCQEMWELMAVSSHSSSERVSQSLSSLPMANPSWSFRRHDEEEAIELRKLFLNKSMSEVDTELAYRAYIVGCNKLDKILRMNVPRLPGDFRISMSSIIIEMKQISRESILSYRKSIARFLKKLPQQVLDIPVNQLPSPLRLHDKLEFRWLNFSTTSLPVFDVISKEVQACDDMDRCDEDLMQFIISQDDFVCLGCCN